MENRKNLKLEPIFNSLSCTIDGLRFNYEVFLVIAP